MPNHLSLAVAGGRKTQGLVDHCKALPSDRRVLVVTFTQTNQQELIHRLRAQAGDLHKTEVLGWYTFLLRHFAKPFLPIKFQGERVGGFNFEGRPSLYAKGRPNSRIDVRMVGDVRQAVLSTNPRGQKNKQYGYAGALEWFQEREKGGLLSIDYATITYRCRTEIASFSDTIFDASWGFPGTTSENHVVTDHDGVFLVHSKHVDQYVERYRPQCLRSTVASGKEFTLDFMNFKVSKGATFERVLIVPTAPIKAFIQNETCLEATPAAAFYVAVTRAKQSLAIVVDKPGKSKLPVWVPF
ncbi:ATP-dependent helicase [Pseudomonas sp. FEN]|uniref:ATP-dependent helicase n=1 Tax=Pseudomonas sp. FEN TaxID=2767468 RepID=UPI001748A78E|nr:ATP-dependent helicase [Pseudomonas sp. FEN]